MGPRAAFLAAILACSVACGPRPRNPFEHRVGVEKEADEASLAAARQMDQIERLIAEGELGRARRELEGTLSSGFDHPRALYLRGRLELAAGGTEAALPWLERSVQASPRWAEPRFHLADAHLRLGNLDAAEAHFAAIDAIAPQAPHGPYGLGHIALRRGQEERGRALVGIALERDPRFPPALLTAAGLAAAAREPGRQRELLTAYLAEQPLDARAHFQLAVLDEAEGLLDNAERGLRRSWHLQRRTETAARLAELLRRRKDPEAATWDARASD